MKTKFKTTLIALLLACSFGVVLAQSEGNNTSQLGNVSEELGDVRWVSLNENETIFDLTQEPILISDNFTSINGTFYLNLTDLSTNARSSSNETAKAKFNFTDPEGRTRYEVTLKNIKNVVESLFTFNCFNGNFSGGNCSGPITYTYGTIWGVGELYVNDTLVGNNRIIRIMTIEQVNTSDKEGYKTIFEKELPRKGIETRLFLSDLVISESGTIEKQPVPTNYTLPEGQNQSFINLIFKDSQFEGNKIFFNNSSGDISRNMTEDMENTNR